MSDSASGRGSGSTGNIAAEAVAVLAESAAAVL